MRHVDAAHDVGLVAVNGAGEPLTEANCALLRTRKFPWPNLVWPFSERRFIKPPEPGSRIATARSSGGMLVKKYDCVTRARVESVTISCCARAALADAHSHDTSSGSAIGFTVISKMSC